MAQPLSNNVPLVCLACFGIDKFNAEIIMLGGNTLFKSALVTQIFQQWVSWI